MQRTIVTPAVLPPSALAELKQWLGITTAHDDAPLESLLRAALDMCGAFTGSMPLAVTCEETLPAGPGWQILATRPVQTIIGVWGLTATGDRFALASDAYAIDLAADGSGRVNVMVPGAATRIVVRFCAGLAQDWAVLPDALRHGVIRLAAHQHREREDTGAAPLPPASVAALWRPFRRLRFA